MLFADAQGFVTTTVTFFEEGNPNNCPIFHLGLVINKILATILGQQLTEHTAEKLGIHSKLVRRDMKDTRVNRLTFCFLDSVQEIANVGSD